MPLAGPQGTSCRERGSKDPMARPELHLDSPHESPDSSRGPCAHKADESLKSQTGTAPFLWRWRTGGAFLGAFSFLSREAPKALSLLNAPAMAELVPALPQPQGGPGEPSPTPLSSERRPRALGFVFLEASEHSSTGRHPARSGLLFSLRPAPQAVAMTTVANPASGKLLEPGEDASRCCCCCSRPLTPGGKQSRRVVKARACARTLLRTPSLHRFFPPPSHWCVAWAIIDPQCPRPQHDSGKRWACDRSCRTSSVLGMNTGSLSKGALSFLWVLRGGCQWPCPLPVFAMGQSKVNTQRGAERAERKPAPQGQSPRSRPWGPGFRD